MASSQLNISPSTPMGATLVDGGATLRFRKPSAALIAEYWGEHRWLATQAPPSGMGFDLGYADGLRDGVRSVLEQTAKGAGAPVDLGLIRQGLQRPPNTTHAWQAYNCIENHDLLLDADGDHRKPRIARLAGGDSPRSWYARSRARVAAGLLLTAPGVPMLFMGQEFLADKLWSDDPNRDDLTIWWDGMEGADRQMADFHRFTRDLLHVRRRHPALRAEPVVVYPLNDNARVLAFHRWVPGTGRDVVVILSLAEATFHNDFELGFPQPGRWHEVFNSDYYDHYPNPWVRGNTGSILADAGPVHDMRAPRGSPSRRTASSFSPGISVTDVHEPGHLTAGAASPGRQGRPGLASVRLSAARGRCEEVAD